MQEIVVGIAIVPGARLALNHILNDDEEDDEEAAESLDLMSELQRPTNFFGKWVPGGSFLKPTQPQLRCRIVFRR